MSSVPIEIEIELTVHVIIVKANSKNIFVGQFET